MFYPDPAAGVAEMARVATRGIVAVWDSIECSDGYLAMQELFADELGPAAAASLDAPFSMGAHGVLEGDLRLRRRGELTFAINYGAGSARAPTPAGATVVPVAFVSAGSSRRQLRVAVGLAALVLAPLGGSVAWLFSGWDNVLPAAAASAPRWRRA